MMPSPFSEFYSGPMLAPDRVGNTLKQSKIFSGPSSVAQMYAGIIPPNGGGMSPVGEGLTALGGWNQFDDQFNSPAPAAHTAETVVPALPANGTGYGFGTGKGASVRLSPSLSYADAFGAALGAQPRSSSAALAAAHEAAAPPFAGVADMFASLSGAGSAFRNGYGAGGLGQTDWTTANQGGAGLNGPVGAPYSGPASPPVTHSAPAAPANSGGSSIAAMFGDPVTLASGTQSTVGATGTAQDGRYSYTVGPGGAIEKTINPFTPAAAEQRAADIASVTGAKGFPGSGRY